MIGLRRSNQGTTDLIEYRSKTRSCGPQFAIDSGPGRISISMENPRRATAKQRHSDPLRLMDNGAAADNYGRRVFGTFLEMGRGGSNSVIDPRMSSRGDNRAIAPNMHINIEGEE